MCVACLQTGSKPEPQTLQILDQETDLTLEQFSTAVKLQGIITSFAVNFPLSLLLNYCDFNGNVDLYHN